MDIDMDMKYCDPSVNIIQEIDTEKLLKTITMQTDYTKEIALEKLKEFDYDCMAVIRSYLGTNNKKVVKKIESLYEPLVKKGAKLFLTTRRGAEIIKYASNSPFVDPSFTPEVSKVLFKTASRK